MMKKFSDIPLGKTIPAAIATLALIAVTYMWMIQKFSDKSTILRFVCFVTVGAFVSYTFPQLVKSWKTGVLKAGGLFTIYQDKHPINFWVNLCGQALAIFVAVMLCIFFYLSIFGVVQGPR